MTVTTLPNRSLPAFVGPTPTAIELAESELIAAGIQFTVVDVHPAADCEPTTPAQILPRAA